MNLGLIIEQIFLVFLVASSFFLYLKSLFRKEGARNLFQRILPVYLPTLKVFGIFPPRFLLGIFLLLISFLSQVFSGFVFLFILIAEFIYQALFISKKNYDWKFSYKRAVLVFCYFALLFSSFFVTKNLYFSVILPYFFGKEVFSFSALILEKLTNAYRGLKFVSIKQKIAKISDRFFLVFGGKNSIKNLEDFLEKVSNSLVYVKMKEFSDLKKVVSSSGDSDKKQAVFWIFDDFGNWKFGKFSNLGIKNVVFFGDFTGSVFSKDKIIDISSFIDEKLSFFVEYTSSIKDLVEMFFSKTHNLKLFSADSRKVENCVIQKVSNERSLTVDFRIGKEIFQKIVPKNLECYLNFLLFFCLSGVELTTD